VGIVVNEAATAAILRTTTRDNAVSSAELGLVPAGKALGSRSRGTGDRRWSGSSARRNASFRRCSEHRSRERGDQVSLSGIANQRAQRAHYRLKRDST
jgi:hypothetical protein